MNDEIFAIQAIYPEMVHTDDALPHCGTLSIAPDIPESGVAIHLDDTELVVHHVPPIELHVELPSDYPHNAPPDVRIECMWMQQDQKERMLTRFHETWEQLRDNVRIHPSVVMWR
jgi:hypothetical protein